MTEQTPVYAATVAAQSGAQGQPVPPPAPVNASAADDLDAKVEALVKAKLSEVEQKYASRITELESALSASRAVTTAARVPANAGGVGTDIAPTWGQYLQELANAGKLTVEHLVNLAGMTAEAAEKVLA